MHIFLEETLGNVQVENVQNLISFLVHFFCERVFLRFGHVLKDTDASCVKSLSVRPLTFFTELFASASNPIEKRIFLLPAGFGFTFGVATYVSDSYLYKDIRTNT